MAMVPRVSYTDICATRAPGTYLLLIQLAAPAQIQVGRLGSVALPAGWYVYIGSALGGLGARLRRHARREKRLHWHIDALRVAGRLAAIAVCPGANRIECATAATVAGLPGSQQLVPRFGSSDCRCRSHLVYFEHAPDLRLDSTWQVVAAPPEE